MWRQQLGGMHLADPVKKLSVKGMDFVMGGRRRFYGGIALARAAEKLPRFVLENGLNPWSAPGRAMPPFAPKTFNGWWKRRISSKAVRNAPCRMAAPSPLLRRGFRGGSDL